MRETAERSRRELEYQTQLLTSISTDAALTRRSAYFAEIRSMHADYPAADWVRQWFDQRSFCQRARHVNAAISARF